MRVVALFSSIIVIILICGMAWLLLYMSRKGTTPRRELVKAQGRRAFDRAARIERPGGPETIDFRKPMWGHNITVELDADRVAHGHFWAQQKVYAGDYCLWVDREHNEHKYRFTFVQHTGNVDDMYRYEAIPTGDSRG